MKVVIIVDMEGATGITSDRSGWVLNGSNDWERFGRDLITGDVVGAATGALAGGAEAVTIFDFHNRRDSIRPEALPPGATLLNFGDFLVPFGGLDRSHRVAFLVGFHAKEGTPGIHAHTVAHHVTDVRLNGLSVGEVGMFAGSLDALGVRFGLITGDQAACDEAAALAPGVETASVKRRLSDGAETALPAAESAELIRARAERAVRRVDELPPMTLGRPTRLEVSLRRPEMAAFELRPGLERVDDRTAAAWTTSAHHAVSFFYEELQPRFMPLVQELVEDDERWWTELKASYPSFDWKSPTFLAERERRGLTHWFGYWTAEARRAIEELVAASSRVLSCDA